MTPSIAMIATIMLSTAVPLCAQSGSLKLPSYQKEKLPNGLTLLLMEQHEVPIVSFQVIVPAGTVADPAGKEGLASLTAGLLRKGTAKRSSDRFAEELDFIGGRLGFDVDPDYATGFAEVLSKDLPKGLDLLSDALLHPTFPLEEFDKLVKQRIDGIKSAKDRARGVIGTYFMSYFYGNHPYGRPEGGDEKSLPAIKQADVDQFYRARYRPAGSILAVAGDFETAEMTRMLQETFGAWTGGRAPAVALPEPKPVTGRRLLLVDKPDATQTFYRLGNLGISRTDPDRVPVGVVNTLLGGRFTSMLNTALRVDSGLTYGANSAFSQRLMPGPFFISTYTRNDATVKAIDMTLDVLRRLHEKGISEEELRSAKNYIKGQFPPSIETTDQLAARLAQLEFYGLDRREIDELYAKIDAVTLEDARRVIREHFPLEDLVFVLMGKASEIENAVSKYAPRIDRKSINDPGF